MIKLDDKQKNLFEANMEDATRGLLGEKKYEVLAAMADTVININVDPWDVCECLEEMGDIGREVAHAIKVNEGL